MKKKYPSYLNLLKTKEHTDRVKKLNSYMKSCCLCPHNCGVNRIEGETGICESTAEVKVSSAFAHFGEESPISGYYGSGTIFISDCNLKCIFCQNYEISHLSEGYYVDTKKLAEIMLRLQNSGCHNINFVTPTHYIAGLVEAIFIAAEQGLNLPLVYNSSGYDSVEVLKLLDGIIDIYMPDFKFSDNKLAKKYTTASDYKENAEKALIEMHRQVGDLKLNNRGIAEEGLLIRHMVIPNNLKNTEGVIKFVAEKISKDTYINIMAQYRPCYKASEFKEINHRITSSEFKTALYTAKEYGLTRGF